jgi:enoyl-[acyl-carrier protein] reductase I
MPGILDNHVALIAGVANKWSIAYAIASSYSREGAKLILTYQGDRQRQTVEELGAELGAAQVLECDVTSDDSIAELLGKLPERLDSFVHSIAFANRDDLSRPFVETSRDGFRLAQDVSVYSLVAMSRALAPRMTAGGAITTLSYLGSVRVIPNYNVMGVAKAALEATVRYLANDLGPSGVRVNAISAGVIKTASLRGIKDATKLLDAVASASPFRRVTDPAEVGDAAVFLASPLGRGVTGNVLYVDAGYSIMGPSKPE